jgi:hypothetical protein
VQQAATTAAVNDASQAMQQIRSQVTDEAQQRQGLQQLGDQLALRMIGTGANASQIEQAFKAVTPQQFGSVEQMQLEGALSGNKQYQNVSKDILKQKQQQGQQQMLFQHKLAVDLEAEKGKWDILKAQMASGLKPHEVKPEEVTFQTNIKMADQFINKLKSSINRSGTWESRFGNPEDAAVLEGAPYQLAITYAKIVDPASVAREGEVAAAQKYLVDLGMTSDKDKVLAQLDNMSKTVKEYQKQRAGSSGIVTPGKQAAPQQSAPGAWQTKKDAKGNIIKFRQLADGRIEVQ